ncbi:hypothetical protein D3C71_1807000 [compost metagenome]
MLQFLYANLDPDRDATLDVVPLFFATVHVSPINAGPKVLPLQFFPANLLLQFFAVLMNGICMLFVAHDRDNDDLRRCHEGREY